MQILPVAAALQDGCDRPMTRAVEELPRQGQEEGIRYVRPDAAAVGEAGGRDCLEEC